MKRTSAPTTYEERVEILFDDSPREFYEVRSSLTLLREETRRNFKSESLWSGAMCVMAGIDLVAKFYTNSDSNRSGGAGKRFSRYLKDMMNLGEREADLVYHARNSYMHSFSLFSKEESKTGNQSFFIHPRFGRHWPFIVRPKWKDGDAIHFELGIDTLFKSFESSLNNLKKHLLTTRPNRFEELFDKYGTDKPLSEVLNFYEYCDITNPRMSKRLFPSRRR